MNKPNTNYNREVSIVGNICEKCFDDFAKDFLNILSGDEAVYKYNEWFKKTYKTEVDAIQLSPIRINITSFGGDVYVGNAIIDLMSESIYPIRTHCYGYAMSMGFNIYVMGDIRTAGENATFMLHNVKGGTSGSNEQTRNKVEHFEALEDTLKDTIVKRTKISADMYDKSRYVDKYIYYKEAIELDIVNADIIDGKGSLDKAMEESVELEQGSIDEEVACSKQNEKEDVNVDLELNKTTSNLDDDFNKAINIGVNPKPFDEISKGKLDVNIPKLYNFKFKAKDDYNCSICANRIMCNDYKTEFNDYNCEYEPVTSPITKCDSHCNSCRCGGTCDLTCKSCDYIEACVCPHKPGEASSKNIIDEVNEETSDLITYDCSICANRTSCYKYNDRVDNECSNYIPINSPIVECNGDCHACRCGVTNEVTCKTCNHYNDCRCKDKPIKSLSELEGATIPFKQDELVF